MRKANYFQCFAMMMLIVASLCAMLSSCESNKEDEPKGDLYVYPWKDYPQSYIKMFDNRMKFQMLNVMRNGTALQFDYTLTNVGFGREVGLTFFLPEAAGHDNLGNTYICDAINSDVLAYINGQSYSIHGWGKSVNFMPNQTIKGSFTIKNFDINATAFSISVYVNKYDPSDLTLAYDRMDFVNIPVPESKGEDSAILLL